MRPVNLIPADQRKGAARISGDSATPVGVYVVLGALGVVLLSVLALVFTSNSVNSKTEELAKVQVQEQGAKQVADALRPYGQFAELQQARQVQIDSLLSTRFGWERSLRQLSRAIPGNAWLLDLKGTLSPAISVEGGGGGDVTQLRQKAEAPAFELSGCTYSQHAVARMMTRMRNLDDVTDVQLGQSARKDQSSSVASAAATQASPDTQAASGDVTDCVGSDRLTKFDLLIVFGGAPGASASGTAGSAGGAVAASSTQQNLSTAQNAAATAQGASSAAGGTTGGTP